MTDYIVDEFGVQYSKDGLRLLKATRNLTNYFVKKNAIEICKEAFKFNTLESIVISESVVIIGELAFANCDNLQYIHLPNTLENIKDRAFVGCTNLRRIYLPLSLKVIGKNPFEGCKSITFINRSINFTVDDNVLFDKNKHTIISFASKKRHYNIPNTVLKIKALTFASCSLDYLNLPASITDIEDEAFFSTSINHINNESIHFTIENNVLFNKSKQKLIYSFNSHENYEVPDSVTIIANSAFAYSFLLNSIKIPDSVKIIGDTAFYMCWGLQTVKMSQSIKSIGIMAFAECKNLNSIFLSSTINKIDIYAFQDCKALKAIYVQKGEKDRFLKMLPNDCDLITEIDKNVQVEDCDTFIDEFGAIYSSDYKILIQVPKQIESYTIKDGTIIIEKRAFKYCNYIQFIVLPNSIVKICNNAFEGCKSLNSITMPESVKIIGENIFMGCCTLQHIYIPKGTFSKFWNMFEDSFNLEYCSLLIER